MLARHIGEHRNVEVHLALNQHAAQRKHGHDDERDEQGRHSLRNQQEQRVKNGRQDVGGDYLRARRAAVLGGEQALPGQEERRRGPANQHSAPYGEHRRVADKNSRVLNIGQDDEAEPPRRIYKGHAHGMERAGRARPHVGKDRPNGKTQRERARLRRKEGRYHDRRLNVQRQKRENASPHRRGIGRQEQRIAEARQNAHTTPTHAVREAVRRHAHPSRPYATTRGPQHNPTAWTIPYPTDKSFTALVKYLVNY